MRGGGRFLCGWGCRECLLWSSNSVLTYLLHDVTQMFHKHSFIYIVHLSEAVTNEDWKLSSSSASSEIGEY